MILHTRAELLRYFGAMSLPALERQFNSDGRRVPVMVDVRGAEVLLATGPAQAHEVIHTMRFPFHVSDFLGQVERDRIEAEARAL